jgi:hypothetical protein
VLRSSARSPLLVSGTIMSACFACDPDSSGAKTHDRDDANAIPTPCQSGLRAAGIAFQATTHAPEHPDGRPDLACAIEDPVLVDPYVHGILFRPATWSNEGEPLLAGCALAGALGRMAEVLSERGVVELMHLGSYGCRAIEGMQQLSEHARANAFDLAEVRLVDSRELSVLRDWEQDEPVPHTEGGMFWRSLTQELYSQGVFNVILTPEFNADHANHIHMDLTDGTRYLSE